MMNNVNLVLGVCLNYCVNGGLCYVEDGTGRPVCICNPGFVGEKCELGLFFFLSQFILARAIDQITYLYVHENI